MSWSREFNIELSGAEKVLIDFLLENGFEDTSWHNDAMPSFERDNLRVWIDYERDKSEIGDFPNWTKYAAYHFDEYYNVDENKPDIYTSDLAELKKFIGAKNA